MMNTKTHKPHPVNMCKPNDKANYTNGEILRIGCKALVIGCSAPILIAVAFTFFLDFSSLGSQRWQ